MRDIMGIQYTYKDELEILEKRLREIPKYITQQELNRIEYLRKQFRERSKKKKFNLIEKENFTIVEFEIENGGVITPKELKYLTPPQVNWEKGVIISGCGPIWLYAYLVHFFHPTAYVGVYDPRLGYVVVESHSPDVSAGDVISDKIF